MDVSRLSRGSVPFSRGSVPLSRENSVQSMWNYIIWSGCPGCPGTHPQTVPGTLPRHADHQVPLCVLCLSVSFSLNKRRNKRNNNKTSKERKTTTNNNKQTTTTTRATTTMYKSILDKKQLLQHHQKNRSNNANNKTNNSNKTNKITICLLALVFSYLVGVASPPPSIFKASLYPPFICCCF